jgi:hypothetical protein
MLFSIKEDLNIKFYSIVFNKSDYIMLPSISLIVLLYYFFVKLFF